MDIVVTLRVKVDLDAWQTEYGSANAVYALEQALTDLSESGWYLQGEKWPGLAEIQSIHAAVDLNGRAS